MKRVAFTALIIAAAFYGALVATPFKKAATTYAQTRCTVAGKQIATPEGTLVCDCTQKDGTNCSCVITCEKGPAPLE